MEYEIRERTEENTSPPAENCSFSFSVNIPRGLLRAAGQAAVFCESSGISSRRKEPGEGRDPRI